MRRMARLTARPPPESSEGRLRIVSLNLASDACAGRQRSLKPVPISSRGETTGGIRVESGDGRNVFATRLRIGPDKSRLRQLDAKRYKRVDAERLDDYAKRRKIG